MLISNGFDQFGQLVRHNPNTIDVVNPFARVIGIRPFLPEFFFALAIFQKERAIWILIFEPPDLQQHGTNLVVIGKRRGADFAGLLGAV
jgi:hypothetical protein